MNEQAQLKEALGALLSLATVSEGMLTMDQILDACEGIGLTEKQVEMVCAYLEMNQVKIQGFAASEEDKSLFRDGSAAVDEEKTGADSAYFKMYLQELDGIQPYTDEEERDLVDAMLAGDANAKEQLIEGNLHRVVQMSQEYLGQGVLAADLVQEGNMALILAMETYMPGTNFRIHLLTEMENAMVDAIREQTGSQDASHTLAADANALMDATEVLADELEREATAEELAEYLHISKERVETLVKISLDAMNLE